MLRFIPHHSVILLSLLRVLRWGETVHCFLSVGPCGRGWNTEELQTKYLRQRKSAFSNTSIEYSQNISVFHTHNFFLVRWILHTERCTPILNSLWFNLRTLSNFLDMPASLAYRTKIYNCTSHIPTCYYKIKAFQGLLEQSFVDIAH